MPISPELFELRGRLEEVGMVVVEEPNHLTVRLPYFCSVRILCTEGRLRFEAYFGIQPRTFATLLKLGGVGALALAAIRAGAPIGLGVAVVALLVGIYDVFRLTITENVITRASMIYSQMRHAPPAARSLTGGTGTMNPQQLRAGDAGAREASDLPRPTESSILKRT